MAAEKSYIDHLNALKADVKSDAIPDAIKEDVLRLIMRLETLLWPYSN